MGLRPASQSMDSCTLLCQGNEWSVLLSRPEVAYPLRTFCASFLTAHHVVASLWLVFTHRGVMWQRTQTVQKGAPLSIILKRSRCPGSPLSQPQDHTAFSDASSEGLRSEVSEETRPETPPLLQCCFLSSSAKVKGLLEPSRVMEIPLIVPTPQDMWVLPEKVRGWQDMNHPHSHLQEEERGSFGPSMASPSSSIIHQTACCGSHSTVTRLTDLCPHKTWNSFLAFKQHQSW